MTFSDKREDSDAPSIHIILLHGTILLGRFGFLRSLPWVRRRLRPPNWIRARSPLPSLLKRFLSDQASHMCTFHRVCWTGGNSMEDRRKAAQRLRGMIGRVSNFSSKAQVYVIAHSHGGNVALEALRDKEKANRVNGLVCLGTPFFRYRPRNRSIVFDILLFFLFFPCSIAGAIGLGARVSLAAHLADNTAETMIVIVTLLLLGGFAIAYFRLLLPWCAQRAVRAERIVSERGAPALENTALLCIESGIQEARWVLEVGRRIRELPIFLAAFIWLSCAVGLFLLIVIGDTGNVPMSDDAFRIFVALFSGMFVSPLLGSLGSLLAGYIYNKLFIGTDSTLDSLFIDADVDLRPADSVGDVQVTVLKSGITLGLQHIRLHDEEQVALEIADWILKVLDGRPSRPFYPLRRVIPVPS